MTTDPMPNPAEQTPDSNSTRAASQSVSATPVQTQAPALATPPVEVFDLPIPQVRALEALVGGAGIAESARAADVDPGTLYRWRHADPKFMAALNAWRIAAVSTAHDRVVALGDEAVRALYRLLRKDNAAVTLAIVRALGLFDKITPGSTDPGELTDKLRRETEKRETARVRRLQARASYMREVGQSLMFERHKLKESIQNTVEGAGKIPENVLRYYRFADELDIEAIGMPGPDDEVNRVRPQKT